MVLPLLILLLLGAPPQPLSSGDQTRTLPFEGRNRNYLVHLPPKLAAQQPAPLVLALHGAAMSARMMARFTGLSDKADRSGFIVVYPNGTPRGGLVPTWNAGGFQGALADDQPDDVAFVAKLLDELQSAVAVDRKRIYATGLSNGGMMCYRLAAELSDRIAAIAPVGGTMAVDTYRPSRPVPVMHFHGTADAFVPVHGPNKEFAWLLAFKPLRETMRLCVEANGCPQTPIVAEEPGTAGEGMTVERTTYGPGKDGSEVVLFTIAGGGHTWPGRDTVPLLGKSTHAISANDLMWEFFQKHPMH